METTTLDRVVIRFAGDSGDGMQLTGDRFTTDTATLGNDFSTLPNFPAEIRAPIGTVAGVSSFQIHFADFDIRTPGDDVDVLVAMNPAALKANLSAVTKGGLLILDAGEFTTRNLAKVGFTENPLTDGSLASYQVHAVNLSGLAVAAVRPFNLGRKDASRTKNMFALGLLTWLYSRPVAGTEAFLAEKFAARPDLAAANVAAFKAGYAFGETTETFAVRYQVQPAPVQPGNYRHINGNTATAYGLYAAAVQSGLPLVLGAYPITPASDVLHTLAGLKDHGVTTLQVEDEIAAAGVALGASYGGALGVTVSSGPGIALKSETISLALMLELPLVIVDVQRAGPSTGLPTKTEQADLSIAFYGRHGEAPVPVLAAASPSDCFAMAFEACRIALTYRTPVFLLTDGYLANGAEPWRIPDDLATIEPGFIRASNASAVAESDDTAAAAPAPAPAPAKGSFAPYARDEKLARPLAIPGTPGFEHRIGGLEKANGSGHISYDPENHALMVGLRAAKVAGISVPDLEVDDPDQADVLVIGWGSTEGPIAAAARRVRLTGRALAVAHLRYLNPMPANLGAVLSRYRRVIVPEMNLGQLAHELRARYLVNAESYSRVRGLPISLTELADDLCDILDGKDVR